MLLFKIIWLYTRSWFETTLDKIQNTMFNRVSTTSCSKPQIRDRTVCLIEIFWKKLDTTFNRIAWANSHETTWTKFRIVSTLSLLMFDCDICSLDCIKSQNNCQICVKYLSISKAIYGVLEASTKRMKLTILSIFSTQDM